ncbi:hypothetical protein CsSME_00014372 [Camellia sinensis var. sinensis]
MFPHSHTCSQLRPTLRRSTSFLFNSSFTAVVDSFTSALQDASVLVKRSFTDITMGLVLDTKEFGEDGTPLILNDITGSEDASGDMDFKVAGNEDRITAFQMDIKAAYCLVFLGHLSDIQWVTTLNLTHSSMTGNRNYFANYEGGAPTSKRWLNAHSW